MASATPGRKSHPYPLPAHALETFRRPHPAHALHGIHRHDGELLVGNGYVAVRAHRGLWMPSEYPEAAGEFLERFGALPWERPLAGPWRALDEASAALWRRGEIGMWDGDRLAASPVWLVVDTLVRLSVLQLVARLPRAEVLVGNADREDPMFFRFAGGRGIIARDRRLTQWSFHLWPPRHDCLTGERLERETRPKPCFSLPGWPPPDCAE